MLKQKEKKDSVELNVNLFISLNCISSKQKAKFAEKKN